MEITFETNLTMAKNFFSVYDAIISLDTHNEKKYYLGNKDNKICRFCNRTEPDVSFENDAHVIPQCLGNMHVLSYFECDSCNELFSKYEMDLARYIGPIRTFASYMGKDRKNPKFEQNDKSLKIKRSNSKIFIEGKIEDITQEQKIRIPFTTKPFIPLNVYKILLKMAYCLLNDQQQKLFPGLSEYLLAPNIELDCDEKIKSTAILLNYVIPFNGFTEPLAYLFRKKTYLANAPFIEYVFVLYFYQCMYQISLPLNINDLWIYETNEPIDLMSYCMPALILFKEESYFFKGCQLVKPVDLSTPYQISLSDELIFTYKGKYNENDEAVINEILKEMKI